MSEHPKGYCPVFGNYPKEYNRAVHGPFYPWVNYGPRDTPFYDVKLGELKGWLGRRNYTPQAMIAATSRYMHLYKFKWLSPRYAAQSKGFFHLIIAASVCSFIGCYSRYVKPHRNHKYHW